MRRILPIIVLSQFCCTSLWFAGNAVMGDLGRDLGLQPGFVAHLTSAVQLGFISGTFIFALLALADRYSPSRLFWLCSIAAAGCNVAIALPSLGTPSLLSFRFLTGLFLAGIYPVGMKIAADYFKEGLGRSLGYLVGALVLGTALPHLIKGLSLGLPWRTVLYATSALSLAGGACIGLLVPDGPYRRKGGRLNPAAWLQGFRQRPFRSAAFGYFGHMWELYTFWTFLPTILQTSQRMHPGQSYSIPLLSFAIIAAGGPACALSGRLSLRYGAGPVAAVCLAFSGLCCLLSPLLLQSPAPVLLPFLFCWSLVVIADSPLFSTLVAKHAPETSKGTSLTMVNCIGFAITIVSIQAMHFLLQQLDLSYAFATLAIGPLLGLAALRKLLWHRQ